MLVRGGFTWCLVSNKLRDAGSGDAAGPDRADARPPCQRASSTREAGPGEPL